MNRVPVGYRRLAIQSVSVRSQGISNVGWWMETGDWWPVHDKLKEIGDTSDNYCRGLLESALHASHDNALVQSICQGIETRIHLSGYEP
jgi:hypothetical protein